MAREPQKPRGCVTTVVGVAIGTIAVMQLAGGIGMFAWAVHAIYRQPNWEMAPVVTLCAAVFGSVGFAMLTAIVAQRLRAPLAGTINPDAPADKPWLARPEWAEGRIPAAGGASPLAPVLAAIAVWWNVATLPLLAALPTYVREIDSHWAWLVLLFPMVGVLLIAAFFYQFLRGQKFGESEFELASVPGVVGGQLAGVVRIPRRIYAPEGFRLRLVCVEWLIHHRQKRDTRVDHVVWQDERLVMDPIVEGNGTGVPVLFAIPFDLPETSRPETEREFEWRLEVWANLPGIDYDATFEVPVYKTAESRRDVRPGETRLAASAARPGSELVLRDAGVVRESIGADGVRLTFRAARNWREALVVSLFPLVFAGFVCVYLPFNEEAQNFFNFKRVWKDLANDPNVMAIVIAIFQTVVAVFCSTMFVLITLVFSLLSLDLWLYRSVVEASPAGLTFRGGWLGVGRTRRFAPEDICRFKAEEYMRSSGGGLWKSVVLIPHRGRGEKLAIGKGIRSKLAQEAVIDELNAAFLQVAPRSM